MIHTHPTLRSNVYNSLTASEFCQPGLKFRIYLTPERESTNLLAAVPHDPFTCLVSENHESLSVLINLFIIYMQLYNMTRRVFCELSFPCCSIYILFYSQIIFHWLYELYMYIVLIYHKFMDSGSFSHFQHLWIMTHIRVCMWPCFLFSGGNQLVSL